jgi:murein DD-endopeptidase MepM/ murein hydrolase activator NlpD
VLLGILVPLAGGAPGAGADATVLLPFTAGTSSRIIQGYTGGTHQGRGRFGLDLVVAGGRTAGATVLAPIAGRVGWTGAPGSGNGCLSLVAEGEQYRVLLCHILLDRAFARGETIARGQRLGTVGPAGAVGNNGAPHVHLELHAGGVPVPFSPPDGLMLEGVALPASGIPNEHAGRAPIVSSNGGAEAASDAAEPASGEAEPSFAAVVVGTDSCLNVRAAPSLAGEVLDCLPDGTAVIVVGAAEAADDQVWRRLDGRGWAAGTYLQPAETA